MKTGLHKIVFIVLLSALTQTQSWSQSTNITVSGQVVDSEGETLVGVNVQIQGTSQGASTDLDGQYTLGDVAENAILVFSYIGYQTQEIPVEGQTTIDVTLVSDAELLEEVVV